MRWTPEIELENLRARVKELEQTRTLRDWFAGQALAGMLLAVHNSQHRASAEGCATTAYRMADAMLAAREPKKEGTP